ncbi:MAG: Membrane protein involved in the export of O-antigen, teichoic acid lipoteichoic acid [Myxococcaceae bacterium]|nr:Membrane protein involved in the export of O-antigen, teichoic acid lipoteichoic acid [Myxococcaceae bacterium]
MAGDEQNPYTPPAAPIAAEHASGQVADRLSGDAHDHTRHEGLLALRNAAKLAASMILTWGVALIVTFKLPKYLGPERFGHYRFGDQFAMSLAVFLSLGVDTYISREIAVRPKHLSEFFGGVLVTRALVILPLIVVAFFFLDGEVHERRLAAGLFALAYLFTALNQTFQQTLQAASKVDGLAVANVVAKVLWGGGTFAAVTMQAPFWVLPLPMVVGEGLKCAFLYVATRDAVDLKLRIDLEETKKVLKISFPFYIANVAVSLGSSIDIVVLGKIVSKTSEEVGWYGSARQIAALSALLSPIMSGVLIPMMSRAKARNVDDFYRILRRGFEAVLVVSLPLTLILALGAEYWIHITIKDRFLPAADSLRWLAPTFVFAYANVLLWLALMILDRSWTITIVSIAGLLLLPVLIIIAVPLFAPMGPGGAGMGVAIALSTRELIIVLVFLAFLREKAMDRRAVASVVKSLLICVAVVVADHFMKPHLIPPLRLALDAALYGLLAVAVGVIAPKDLKAVLKMVKDRKKNAAS